MLMTMKSLTQAARTICYATAGAVDLSKHHPDEDERRKFDALAWLLTPVAKAFSTDTGVEVASIGIQVHGGMGYIEETGAAQHYRDARITPIYEGTNGIQAIDLVTRKLPLGKGEVIGGFIEYLSDIATDVLASNDPGFGRMGYRLSEAIEALKETTDWMLQSLVEKNIDAALASATPYLRLFGLTTGGTLLARGALNRSKKVNGKGSDADAARIALARYFAENHMPETTSLSQIVRGGAEGLVETTPEQIAL